MLEAIFGLVGVVVGASLTSLQTFLTDRKTRLDNGRYLAIRVVCILDLYVDKCASVVLDDGLSYGQRNEDGYLTPQIPTPPPLTYPDDIDWRAIKTDLMYELLSLPSRAESENATIDFYWGIAHPPDFDEYFDTRRRAYIDLGLRSAQQALRLRELYAVPEKVYGEWNPIERLRQEKGRLEQLDRARAKNEELSDLPD